MKNILRYLLGFALSRFIMVWVPILLMFLGSRLLVMSKVFVSNLWVMAIILLLTGVGYLFCIKYYKRFDPKLWLGFVLTFFMVLSFVFLCYHIIKLKPNAGIYKKAYINDKGELIPSEVD